MASIQRQGPHKDGSFSYRVAWRERGHQRTKTFRTLAEAEQFAASPATTGRRIEITRLRVDDLDLNPGGGSASIQVDWDWVR